jgi:Zn-finger nucleic acid-binding protein
MPGHIPCPSCRASLDSRQFEGKLMDEVSLDICWDCHAIWFDQYESAHLAPRAVLELFRLIHEYRDRPARQLADSMGCIRCGTTLIFTQDLQRTNRITYYRCAHGHGRFTTFFQFLREKQFVRSLTALEIDRLRATVKQVRCSSCGAPVDLAKDSACPFCRAAISVLDDDAVQKAIAGLTEAENRRVNPDPRAMADTVADAVLKRPVTPGASPWMRDISPMQDSTALVDLVVEGLEMLFQR